LTVIGQPVGRVTSPAVVKPSRQSIVAVYSPAVAAESASVKLATAPENDAPSVAPMFLPVATIAAAAQLTVTSLLVWVFARLSTKLASSVSVPGVAPTKLNEALPEAFVVPVPVRPASGPLTTLKVTL